MHRTVVARNHHEGIHGEGGAYGRISTPSVESWMSLRYDHVWNNGNEGKGKVTDTFSISRTKPHVWPLPPMPPPGPPIPPPYPGPPPTPQAPPAPPPAGARWSCHDSKTVYCEDVGLAYGYLKGEGATLPLCERASNGLADVAALLFHGAYSPKRCRYSDVPLYISLVIIHTKYTGVRQNDSNVYA